MNKPESEKQGQHDSLMRGICIQVYMCVYTYPYMLHMYVGPERIKGNYKWGRRKREGQKGALFGRSEPARRWMLGLTNNKV